MAEAFLAAADEIQCQGPLEIGVALASALRPVFHILIVTCSTTKPVFGGLTSNNTTKLANMVGFHGNIIGISWDNADLPPGVIRRGLLENPLSIERAAGRFRWENHRTLRFSSHV